MTKFLFIFIEIMETVTDKYHVIMTATFDKDELKIKLGKLLFWDTVLDL